MNEHELESKCRELRQLQALIEEAQAAAETIKDELKAHMGDKQIMRAGEYTVTWNPVTTHRLDALALRQAAPELAQRFMVENITRRFRVA